MGKKRKVLVLLSVLIIPALLLGGCSRGFVPGGASAVSAAPLPPVTARPTNGLTQSSEGGGVTINVKWLGLRDSSLMFEVVMDTHSDELDGYDLKKLSLLSDSSGGLYPVVLWDSPPGGHHRSGSLGFEYKSALTPGESKAFELVIRDIAGVPERILTWRLN